MALRTDPSGRPLGPNVPRTAFKGTEGRYGSLTPQQQAQGWYYNESGMLLDRTGAPIDQQGRQLTGTQTDPSSYDRNPNGTLQNPALAGRTGVAGGPGATPPPPGRATAVSPPQQGGLATAPGGTTSPGLPGGRPVDDPLAGKKIFDNGASNEAARGLGGAPQLPRSYDKLGHASDNSQPIGDDNPWKIGRIEGGTYDPKTMAMWVDKADAGDKSAQWVLQQVGYHGQPVQQWVQERKLDKYVPDEASAYMHDPGYDDNYRYQAGKGYGNQANAAASYGWWDDSAVTPRTGPREDPGQNMNAGGAGPGDKVVATSSEPPPEAGRDATPQIPAYDPSPQNGVDSVAINDAPKKRPEEEYDWRNDDYFKR